MVKDIESRKEKKSFIWVLLAIVIPIIILIILAIVIMSFIGVDVGGWAKEKSSSIPVVSKFISSDEDEEILNQLEDANEKIMMQKEEISDLEREITSLEGIVDDQEMDIKKMENRNKDEDEADTGDVVDEVKKAASSFRKMDTKKAAGIVQKMDKKTAIEVLSELSGDVRGGILAEMEPKFAAEVMEGMLK